MARVDQGGQGIARCAAVVVVVLRADQDQHRCAGELDPLHAAEVDGYRGILALSQALRLRACGSICAADTSSKTIVARERSS